MLQDKRHNEILLQYALQKERLQIEAEENKKKMNKNAGHEYQFYLQQQMQLQQEEDAYIAEAERRAQENVSKQRDDALDARSEARRQLMTEGNYCILTIYLPTYIFTNITLINAITYLLNFTTVTCILTYF